MEIPIDDIIRNKRFRKDLGDIEGLANSIKNLGLIQPIIVTKKNELICGARRVKAHEKLGLSTIEANVFDITSDNLSQAEAEENIQRKNFTINEIAEIDEFYRKREDKEARNRQKQGKALPSGNFPRGRSRERIAARVGISDRTLEKIRIIKEASVKDIKLQNIWQKVGSGKMKIDKGFKKTQKILKVQEALLDLNLNNNSKLNPNKILLLNGDMRETWKKY